MTSIHASITPDRLVEAMEQDEHPGFCINCGEPAEDYVEPDARRYRCSFCRTDGVYGAEELLLMTV